MKGQLLVASSSLRELMGKHFDLTIPSIEDPFHFVSAEPKLLNTYDSLLRPLNLIVWAAVMTLLTCFSLMFYITYVTYSSKNCFDTLLKCKRGNALTFYLYTLCKVKDPASIPWFTTHFSTGTLLTFLYTVFCFIITAMYSCNLHAHLVAVEREKPIDTAQDVINNGQRPWILTEMGVFT